MDALYFSVTTLTTVGLGDLTPATSVGIYIFSVLGIILGFKNTVAKETLNRRTRGRHGEEEDAAAN